MTDAYDATWLDSETYDLERASDFNLFTAAARKNLTAHVPTCPDWDMTALCDHLARVYQGRTYAIRHGAFLDRDAFEVRADEVHPVDWVERWYVELDRALRGSEDDAETVTFVPGVTVVRFWRRRMALETLVHRTDAELAVGDVSPMHDALSADGVDELLWFMSHPDDDELAHADGLPARSVVAITDGARTWRVELSDGTVATPPPDEAAQATVQGSAPALLLALSGRDLDGIGPHRFGVEPIVVEGDHAAYERLRKKLGDF